MAGATIQIRVPGKVILAGEYAVLHQGPAIVCAIDRYLECEVSSSSRLFIEGNGAYWEDGQEINGSLYFACEALRVAQDYLLGKRAPSPKIGLVFRDELRAPNKMKLGLGGSACVCVAAVAAILFAAGMKVNRETVYKLAAVAHGGAQQQAGSAIDIAASVFGGTIYTFCLDIEALLLARELGPEFFASQIDGASLPARKRISSPSGLMLAFSGQPSFTGSLLERVDSFHKRQPDLFMDFVRKSRAAAETMKTSLQNNNYENCEPNLNDAVKMAQENLQQLSDLAQANIVTSAHLEMIKIAKDENLAMKISGAGGGDCALAIGAIPALRRLQYQLEQAGYYAWIPQVDDQGFNM